MRRWLRHHRYAVRVALRRLAAQPFSTLANIFVISLSLAVPILAASVLLSAQPIARQVPVSPEITLFLATDASAEQATALADRLRQDHDTVASVRRVPRAQALETLKSSPAWADALAVLQDNPLPDAVIVTLRETPDLAVQAASLAQQWRELDYVDAVQLDSEWVRRLEAILQFLRIGLGLLAASVALVVLGTVFNTVRMQALTQRDEIAVARLVGATESFVRRPFLYLGALTGLISGAVALALAWLALHPLNTALARLASTYGAQISLRLPDAASLALSLVVVAILAAVAARWSVTRNTRF